MALEVAKALGTVRGIADGVGGNGVTGNRKMKKQ